MEKENNIYVGNLPWTVDDAKLAEIFSGVEGVKVVSAAVIRDRFSDNNRSKGFGFVTVEEPGMIEIAVKALNGQMVQNRPLVVNEAREKKSHDDRNSR